MKKLFMAIAAVMVLLSGCAGLSENTSARILTQYSVLKVTDGDAAKAARVEEIALEVRAYATGEQYLTVDLLVAAIRDQVRWEKLDAADELLVRSLLIELRNELVRRFGADVLPEDARLAVDTVAGWVITAARI